MKRIGILQPYFMQYLVYYQVLRACDEVVILDDDYFKPQGWIHRNKIRLRSETIWFTIPVRSGSQNRLIHDIEIVDQKFWLRSHSMKLAHAYGKTENFSSVVPPLMNVLRSSRSLLEILISSIDFVVTYMNLPVKILYSSEIFSRYNAVGSDRIIGICQSLGASCYINLPGGRSLYDASKFLKAGVSLNFVRPDPRALEITEGLSSLHFLCSLSGKNLEKALSSFDLE